MDRTGQVGAGPRTMQEFADGAESTITRYLQAWSDGDAGAREHLFELVYARLSQMAANRLRNENGGLTLETRDLVHEAFLKLVDQQRVRWQDRAHFFNISARIMRRILVDHARRAKSSKRGGDQILVSAEEVATIAVRGTPDLIELHRALEVLERQDSLLARVVLLRVFAGLTQEEAAEILDVSLRTVARSWRRAKAWLYAHMVEGTQDEP